MVCSTFLRNGWSIVGSASLAAKGGTSKRDHHHPSTKFQLGSSKVNPQTSQMALVFLTTPMQSTCFITFLDLFTLIIFVEVCKLWSSSLCRFLQCPVTSAPLGQKYSTTTLISKLSLFFVLPLGWDGWMEKRDQASYPYKTTDKYSFSFSFFLFVLFSVGGRKKRFWTEW